MPKIHKVNILFLSAIAFILFNNADCSNKKETTYYFSEEFKSYVIFNKDSYWIYKSKTNDYDTIKLTQINHDIVDSPKNPPHEIYHLFKSSSFHGDLSYTAACKSYTNHIGCKDFSWYSNTSGSISAGFYFFCCCDEGTKNESATYLGETEDEINGMPLQNVKIFQIDSIFPTSLKTLWYAPDIGLIRFHDYQNNQWELIEFDIKS